MDIGFFNLFFMTLVPVSRQTIKNTFKERLKRYYTQSNKVNTVFYILFAATGFVYFLMKMIG